MNSRSRRLLGASLGLALVLVVPALRAQTQTATSGWLLSDQDYAKLQKDLLTHRKSGGTVWMSEEWMKDAEYYKSLSTLTLAEECFSRPILWAESGLHSDERVMYLRLRIFHNGFAELFEREDLWKGILHVLEGISGKITTKSDRHTLFRDTCLLECTGAIMGIPELQDQLAEKEELFIIAHQNILKQFRAYLKTYDPRADNWGSIPFVLESVSVYGSASRLAIRLNSSRSAQLPSPGSPGGHQNESALEQYLDAAIANIQQFIQTQNGVATSQKVAQDAKDAVAKKEAELTQNGATVHARHILISFTGAEKSIQAQQLAKAERVRASLIAGMEFEAAAKQYSACPSKEHGGDLGSFPRGAMVKPFEEAAFSQKVGEIGPVVYTKFGYHIIQVLDRENE